MPIEGLEEMIPQPPEPDHLESTSPEYREWLDVRRRNALIFQRNRRKILRTIPPDQKRAYLKACDLAWAEGRPCPKWPFGEVPSTLPL